MGKLSEYHQVGCGGEKGPLFLHNAQITSQTRLQHLLSNILHWQAHRVHNDTIHVYVRHRPDLLNRLGELGPMSSMYVHISRDTLCEHLILCTCTVGSYTMAKEIISIRKVTFETICQRLERIPYTALRCYQHKLVELLPLPRRLYEGAPKAVLQ